MTLPSKPKCILIAGPNGAGKTTFALQAVKVLCGERKMRRKFAN